MSDFGKYSNLIAQVETKTFPVENKHAIIIVGNHTKVVRGVMISEDDARDIVSTIKARRRTWRVSHREKNEEFASIIGNAGDTDEGIHEKVFDEIFNNLTWTDYSSGPFPDTSRRHIPGNVWIFGLKIFEIECYLKFQDRASGRVMWISIHEAERALSFPFR